MPSSWFHDALSASVSALGPRASDALGLLRSLPVDAVRSNVAHGLAFADSRGRKLWPHQSEAVGSIEAHLLNVANDPTAIVIMPTGSGKTEIILRTVESSGLDAGQARIAVPTIVLVPTRQLAAQTTKAFRDRFPKLHVSQLGDGNVLPASVTVMTYDLFIDMLSDGRLEKGDIRALVMDEAHRGLSDLRQDVISRMLGDVVLTAYSATPAFDAVKNVYGLLGAKNVVARVSDERMRHAGVISPVVDYVLRVRIKGELPTDRLERADIVRTACENAVKDFLAGHVEALTGIPLRDKTYLGYANGIERAHGLAKALAASGIPAEAVSGRDSTKAIEGKLAQLASGMIQVLVNDQILLEGTDIPEARGILAFSPTTSLVKHLQRCGRARRIDPRYPSGDPRQVTSIIETFVEVNGVPIPGQRIYADAIGDMGVVRIVDGPVQTVSELTFKASGGKRGARGALPMHDGDRRSGGWVETSNDLDGIHYMLGESNLAPAPAGYVSWVAIANKLRVRHSNKALTGAVDGLVADLRVGNPTEVEGVPVRVGTFYLANGFRGLCIHEDDIDAFRSLLGDGDRIEPWEEGWLPIYLFAERIGVTRGNPRFRELWDDALEGRFEVPAAPDGGPAVRVMRFRSHRVGYAHPAAVPAFLDALGMAGKMDHPKKDGTHVPYTTLCRRHNVAVHNTAFKALWSQLAEAHKSFGKAVVDGREVGFGLFRTVTNNVSYCISESDIPWFVEKVGYLGRQTLPEKTDDWMTKEEAAALLGRETLVLPGLGKLWQRLSASSGTSNAERARWGGARFAIGNREGGTFCLPRSKLDDLRNLFLGSDYIPKTPEWMTLEAVRAIHATEGPIRLRMKKAWRELEQAYERDPTSVPYRVGHRSRLSYRYFCMLDEDVQAFVDKIAATLNEQADGEGWLTKTDTIPRIHNALRAPAFHEAWELLTELGKDGPVMDGERNVAFALKTNRTTRWCLHESELPWFSDLCGLPMRVSEIDPPSDTVGEDHLVEQTDFRP